ncbi:MAG: tRNA (adenosine(37)-N6)-dimethylallyltransferase MiaA [Gammaproteobacteria bacterium]|nr:tRNA (adenosine(37)-N6)-dimethylallyltransferase MiaA [Gammaproteobacteria bacterium]
MGETPVVFLMGPTGAGKTAAAFAISARLPVEVISVDAAQIYRHLDVGTAKPSRAERRTVPHHLVDICHVSQTYSAAHFVADAGALIGACLRRGHIPLLVGGTSFYFHALEHGLPQTPPADPVLRQQLADRAAQEGWAALHAELRARDPQAAARIAPTDPQRIQRALEIVLTQGRIPPRSAGKGLSRRILKLAVAPADRAVLHQRLGVRFRRMLARGLLEETAWLLEQGLDPGLPALRLVGYRQAGEYLRNKIQYNELVEQGVAATRQLAKRQLTWLRGDPEVCWFDSTKCDVGPLCADSIEAAVVGRDAKY